MFKNKRWAKKLSLEVWGYLKDHPEIKSKCALPPEIWDKIKSLVFNCPLCVLYSDKKCKGCPLGNCGSESAYCRWLWFPAKQQQAATEIYNRIKEWKI